MISDVELLGGAQHLDAVRDAYAKAGVQAEIVTFIDDMAARYADRVAILENGRLTALGAARSILEPERLSTVFATPIVRVEASGAVAFLSPGGNTLPRT